ncbi:Apolipoprotein N-acyltransferase [Streptomyces antimycoticus]
MRLVPFGEYIPARSLLGWATSVGKAAGEDRRRGSEQVVMTTGPGLRIGPMVCFETAFPDMSRHLTDAGTDVAGRPVVDVDLPGELGAQQHASLGALRAAETGRPFVHSTLTGVSAVYDAEPQAPRARGWGRARAPGRVRGAAHGRRTPRTSASATGRCTRPCWCSRPSVARRGRGRSGCAERSRTARCRTLAQFMSRQRVPRAEHLARAHGVEEGQHRLLDARRCRAAGTQSPRRRTVGCPLWSMISARLTTCRLLSCPDASDLLVGAAQPVHHAQRGEAVPGELEHDVVQQPVHDPGPYGHVVHRVRHKQGVDGLTHGRRTRRPGSPRAPPRTSRAPGRRFLELAVRRLADREARVLALHEMPDPQAGSPAVVDALALATHRALTRHRELTLARYELALEATRRPELRAHFDAADRFQSITAYHHGDGLDRPARHVLSLVAWADGLMFAAWPVRSTRMPARTRCAPGCGNCSPGCWGRKTRGGTAHARDTMCP